jgi:hypothetical protein
MAMLAVLHLLSAGREFGAEVYSCCRTLAANLVLAPAQQNGPPSTS